MTPAQPVIAETLSGLETTISQLKEMEQALRAEGEVDPMMKFLATTLWHHVTRLEAHHAALHAQMCAANQIVRVAA